MPAKIRRSKVLVSRPSPRSDLSLADRQGAKATLSEFFAVWHANREAMLEIDRWQRNELDDEQKPVMPEEATDEFRRLRDTAIGGYGRLVVSTLVQNALVEDIRLRDTKQSAPASRLWQRNGMDARQVPLVTAAATYGQSFNLVLPATGRLDGEPTAVFMGYSGLRGVGFYADPAHDEYPEFFLEGEPYFDKAEGARRWRMQLVNDYACYYFTAADDGSDIRTVDGNGGRRHDMGLTPVVRYVNEIDLEGRVTGEIAPIITTLARIDQDTQDRLVVQRFGAWVVRTIAGMKKPTSEADQAAARIALGVGSFLVSEDADTKFGHIPATPLQGHLSAHDTDLRDLAALSQTPSHHLLGASDNLGADGLAAAEATHMRKADIRKLGWGESHENSVRLGGQAMGDDEIANDFESRVHWRQTRSEAFQSLAQAIGTLVAAGVPLELLVTRISDWTQADTQMMKDLAAQQDAKDRLRAEEDSARQIEAQVKVARAKEAEGGNAPAAR